MSEDQRPAKDWVEIDNSRRDEGGVLLCPSPCFGIGRCRLGILTERAAGDGVAQFDIVCPPDEDEGYGFAHGGWILSVLCELAGHALILASGGHGFLGTFNVRFTKPVVIGDRLRGVAQVEGRERRKAFVTAELLSAAGDSLANASAILITAPT